MCEAALGGNLYQLICAGAIPENMARKYFRQLIAGIRLMNGRGIYHRELKFENILLDEALGLKKADFG